MRALKALFRLLVALVAFAGLAWVFAPQEPVDRIVAFNEAALPDDLDGYLARNEASFDDIVLGTHKRIVWADKVGAATPLSIVFLHGFSATSEEIRPVPDRLAAQLGANLYFARLSGHGRTGDALASPQAGDWIEDTAEALAIGRRIGQEVIVLSSSTGGTLSTIAATDPDLSRAVKGFVMLAPNFGLNNSAAFLLELPLVRYWGPWVAGAERSFEPQNAQHAQFWTERYPTNALVPMAALVRHTLALDFATATAPALFILSDDDAVVRSDISRDVAGLWGRGAEVMALELGPGDDPFSHVIAGDILSPGQTDTVVVAILNWIQTLP